MVAPEVMYHGAQDWLRRLARKRGIGLSLVDATNATKVREAVRPGETAIVWIEPLLNPTWAVVDIAAAAAAAHEGRRNFSR